MIRYKKIYNPKGKNLTSREKPNETVEESRDRIKKRIVLLHTRKWWYIPPTHTRIFRCLYIGHIIYAFPVR